MAQASAAITASAAASSQSIAGPKRPQDRISLSDAKQAFRAAVNDYVAHDEQESVVTAVDESLAETFPASDVPAVRPNGHEHPTETAMSQGRPQRPVAVTLADGSVLIVGGYNETADGGTDCLTQDQRTGLASAVRFVPGR